VTYKTGFQFDDRIYWTLIQLVIIFHKSLSSTGHYTDLLLHYYWRQIQSHIATDGQPVSKSWCRAPSGAHDQLCITVWQLRFCSLWGVLSNERTGLSFVYDAGPCQRGLSPFRISWDSRPYFSLSDLRLPLSSPPTTRRVTVEAESFTVIQPRGGLHRKYVHWLGMDVYYCRIFLVALPSNGLFAKNLPPWAGAYRTVA
jgi:hypothetical protein